MGIVKTVFLVGAAVLVGLVAFVVFLGAMCSPMSPQARAASQKTVDAANRSMAESEAMLDQAKAEASAVIDPSLVPLTLSARLDTDPRFVLVTIRIDNQSRQTLRRLSADVRIGKHRIKKVTLFQSEAGLAPGSVYDGTLTPLRLDAGESVTASDVTVAGYDRAEANERVNP